VHTGFLVIKPVDKKAIWKTYAQTGGLLQCSNIAAL
jgi:hypothetical protein